MSDFFQQIEELSPEKRELLNLFLQEENPELQDNYVAPRTPFEEALANIWIQVLGIKQVGIHDNFFELGGDSIKSIQIIAKANQLGLLFTTNQLFDYPTIAELASVTQTNQEVILESQILTPTQENKSTIKVNFTPSDFPAAELTQEQLNQMFIQ